MRLFRQTAVVVGVVALAACLEVPEAPSELTVTLSATTAWAGGTVRLVSAGFASLKAPPTVSLGANTVPVTAVNDSTVEITLPQVVGSFDVWITAGRTRTYAGVLRLTGFQAASPGPVFSGTPYWLVPGGSPLLIGEGDHGAAILDVALNTVLQITPDSIHSPDCAITVGPTYQPGNWVLTGSVIGGCRKPQVWAVTGPSPYTLTPGDTNGSMGNGEAWWVMAQPAPGRWVLDWNNNMYLIDCSVGTGCPRQEWRRDRNDVDQILLSPKGDRYVLLPSDAGEKTIAYDAARLDTAYTLPWAENSGTFSLDGDTLYLIGYDGQVPHLQAVSASTGQVWHDQTLDSLGIPTLGDEGIALDPVHPWLYVILSTSDVADFFQGTQVLDLLLVVVDRNTWRVIGVAPTAPMVAPLPQCCQGTVVPSPPDHAVFLVLTSTSYGSHGTHATVARFDTP